MELTKYRKYLKEDNYVHCTVCGNYRNINSYAHRKSEDHQKNLSFKLRKISFHLSQKKKKPVVIHDEDWSEKSSKRFCHFCGESYTEHYCEDEFVIENLGVLYHHANSSHSEAVKSFLKRNYRKESSEEFCVKNGALNRFLQKLPEEKARYLKKMDVIHNMILKQIKDSEEERKKFINSSSETLSSSNYEIQKSEFNNLNKSCEIKSASSVLKSVMISDTVKVPPWLEDVTSGSSVPLNLSTAPVIGPTMDSLMEHVESQKKRRLPKARIGADFKHHDKVSAKWLPSFQSVWHQGHRKQLGIQFSRRNKKYS